MRAVIEVMYGHRLPYLKDGVYAEGVAEYSYMSLESTLELHKLMLQTLNMPLQALLWDDVSKVSRWHVDSMLPDGFLTNFGDSHDKQGFDSLATVYSHLVKEIIDPSQKVTIDACLMRDYWSNKWFTKGFDNPWELHAAVARNWTAVVIACMM